MRLDRRSIWTLACGAGVLVLAAGVRHDMLAAGRAPVAAPAPEDKPPPDVLDPPSAAVRLEGARRKAHLARPPLRIGMRAPDLTFSRGKVPAAFGKPQVWVVLCGCWDCAQAGTHVGRLESDHPGQMRHVVFGATKSDYVVSMMRQSFGGRNVIWDREGEALFRLRAPDVERSNRPMVWGMDGEGIVRFFARPAREEKAWVEELARTLRLKRPKPDFSAPYQGSP